MERTVNSAALCLPFGHEIEPDTGYQHICLKYRKKFAVICSILNRMEHKYDIFIGWLNLPDQNSIFMGEGNEPGN